MTQDELARLREAVNGARAQLEERRQRVNELNVFPVADADTGDNLALTVAAMERELPGLDGQSMPAAADRLARAALMGARGNSGVILSQMVRGAADVACAGVGPRWMSALLAGAAEVAYGAVPDPVEGTMLSAARAMADGAASAPLGTAPLEVLARALDHGRRELARGPERLAVLKEAGVVDAGAYGLTLLVAGALRGLGGHPPAPDPPSVTSEAAVLHAGPSRFRWCTNFTVSGRALDRLSLLRSLEELGDSVLVVGDAATLRVHLHTDAPEAATGLSNTHGAVAHLEAADMHAQLAARR